jgi:glyoxylase-like metal-dependent hydrolase (beta-lactamase superfamily II)
MNVSVELMSVGSTRHFGALAGLPALGLTRFPALAALIRHPAAGAILFDTGYGSRVLNGGGLPLAAYRRLLPVRLGEDARIDSQLWHRGIDPGELALIILSHLHPDHIGGLWDLPPRPVLWSRDARDALSAGSAYSRFRKGIFPALVPDYAATQARLLEGCPAARESDLPPGFPRGFDVLGDGSLTGVPLPGHARGQFGLLCRVEGGRSVFLIADAAWVSINVTDATNPKAILDHIAHDAPVYHKTLDALRALHRARPDIIMVPSHCAASLESRRLD